MQQKLGQRVNIASHGQEAFDTFQRETFDLILMDMQMPGIDGLEATVMIRTHEKTHRLAAIPIIALTANAMPEDRQRCIAADMNDFLSPSRSRSAHCGKPWPFIPPLIALPRSGICYHPAQTGAR